jgi:hypothetical protein
MMSTETVIGSSKPKRGQPEAPKESAEPPFPTKGQKKLPRPRNGGKTTRAVKIKAMEAATIKPPQERVRQTSQKKKGEPTK